MEKYLFTIAVLLSVMLFSCSQTVQVYDNSQWWSERRDGIYMEAGLLRVWPEDGPQLLWHFEGIG